jgi:hypothetical protein
MIAILLGLLAMIGWLPAKTGTPQGARTGLGYAGVNMPCSHDWEIGLHPMAPVHSQTYAQRTIDKTNNLIMRTFALILAGTILTSSLCLAQLRPAPPQQPLSPPLQPVLPSPQLPGPPPQLPDNPQLPGISPQTPNIPSQPGTLPVIPGNPSQLPGITPQMPAIPPQLPGIQPQMPRTVPMQPVAPHASPPQSGAQPYLSGMPA